MSLRLYILAVAAMVAIPALLAVAAEPPVATPAAATPAESSGFTGNGTQPPINFTMFSPSNCAVCHGNIDGMNGTEPSDSWAGSMMAQATRDPLFWAALDVANNDALNDDDIPDDIGQFCLRCHTPAGWLEGRAGADPSGCGGTGGLEGFIDDVDGDFDGITCHTCHRTMINDDPPMGEENFYLENGQLWIDDVACPDWSEPCRHGPYDYDGKDSPDNPPPHPWTFSSYLESSDFCGSCHNVSNPAKTLIDDQGVDTTLPFPIERTHREWEVSDFRAGGATEQTCQSCHMPDSTLDPAMPCFFGNNQTGDMPIHQFAGGNTWIPDVLKGEYPDLGLGDAFDRTKALALDMLQNRSAVVEVTVDPEVVGGEVLDAQVKITNTSGHKLPTGYSEGRRMWINVQARDAQDNLIWESGAYEPTTGVLTEDPQAKVYRVEQGIWNRNGTNECDIVDDQSQPIFHFVLSDCILLDNRIPPLGFKPEGDPELVPVGYTYPEESLRPGVLVNYDTTDYSIPIPVGTEGPVSVTASLHYQTSSKEYIEFLRDQAVDNSFPDDCTPRLGTPPGKSRGELMFDLWESYDRSPPVEMGSASGDSMVTTVQDQEDVTGTIDDEQTVQACNTVVLGPGLILESTADLTVRAGINVEVHETVEIRLGAQLQIEIVPGLCS